MSAHAIQIATRRPLIELCDLWKEYELGQAKVSALRAIELTVHAGEFTVVSGPSGSGKTTLLNIIGMLDCPSRGEYRIDGEPVAARDFDALAEVRNRTIGFVFQTFNLIPVLSVYENIEFPLRAVGRHTDRAELESLADCVGLGAYLRRRPDELSGGQRQRVAIARALATSPRLILADEPTANLDGETTQSIMELMQRLNDERGVTFLFSSHDPRVMSRARRIVELRDGRIERDSASASAA